METYKGYTIEELEKMYEEAKFKAFMTRSWVDKKSWIHWCKISADLNYILYKLKNEVHNDGN